MGSFITTSVLAGSFIDFFLFLFLLVDLVLVEGISLAVGSALHEGTACMGSGLSFSHGPCSWSTSCLFMPSVLGVMPLLISISSVLFSSAESVPTTTDLTSPLPVWVLVYQIWYIGWVQYAVSTQ